jgi:hypothetical protein
MRCEDGVAHAFILAGTTAARRPLLFAGKEKIVDGHGAPPPILAMGQNVVGENSGVAELFIYAAATGVLIGLVLLMPPYRPANWISGREAGHDGAVEECLRGPGYLAQAEGFGR